MKKNRNDLATEVTEDNENCLVSEIGHRFTQMNTEKTLWVFINPKNLCLSVSEKISG